jgi:SnoaL-like domain
MINSNILAEIVDKQSIADLIQFERVYRDQQQWEQLRTFYHPDSVIRLGWFVGNGDEYVEASRRLDADKKSWHFMHITNPTLIQLHGERAIAGTNTQIMRRTQLEGILVDVTIYCHLYSRVEKRAGKWRILTLDVIYEKDTAVPVYASDHLELNQEVLQQGPPSYRFSAYNLSKIGRSVRADELYSTDQPERVAHLFSEATSWLYQETAITSPSISS